MLNTTTGVPGSIHESANIIGTDGLVNNTAPIHADLIASGVDPQSLTLLSSVNDAIFDTGAPGDNAIGLAIVSDTIASQPADTIAIVVDFFSFASSRR